jgi:hypothetical protein
MMKREDLLTLIIDHASNQGLLDNEYANMLDDLSDTELDNELNRLEQLAVYRYCDMPNPTAAKVIKC